jgi:hypothetical protein
MRMAVIVGLVVAIAAEPAGFAAPAPCVIIEGAGIAGLRIGMSVSSALALTGPPLRQQVVGVETVYSLRPPWATMITRDGLVRRVTTRSAECRTARAVGPGTTTAQARAAYAGAPVSTITATPDGDLLSYPFGGIAFLLRGDRVEAAEVFAAMELSVPAPGPPPATVAPSPAATAPAAGVPSPAAATVPGTWRIVSLTARLEQQVLVVTGAVENQSRAQSVYAEARAFSPAGYLVGQADAPLHPSPVGVGVTATFEVRMQVDDVVRRYAVVVRPVGAISGALAERSGEITQNLQQFAEIVARQIRVEVLTSINPATRDSFSVTVTNASALAVDSVTVAVDLTVTCQIASIFQPSPRRVQEVRSGTAVVQQLRPGAGGRAALPISPGVCLEFATWSAETRVGQVRIGAAD